MMTAKTRFESMLVLSFNDATGSANAIEEEVGD